MVLLMCFILVILYGACEISRIQMLHKLQRRWLFVVWAFVWNPLLYDCCTCHRRFYHAIYDIPLDIGACIIKYNGGLMVANYFIIMGPMPVIAVHVDALNHYISLHHQYHHHVLIKLHKIQLSTLFSHRNMKLCWLLLMMNIWKKILI